MGKQPAVIDVEATEVIEAQETETTVMPRCEIRVGMDQEGKLYFDLRGDDQNLVIIEGLIKYATKHINKIWDERV